MFVSGGKNLEKKVIEEITLNIDKNHPRNIFQHYPRFQIPSPNSLGGVREGTDTQTDRQRCLAY